DRHHLVDGLPGAEDHLGMPLPQAPVVVDAGEAEILEREVSQPAYGALGREATCSDFLEQLFQLSGGHATCATGSRYSRKIASASVTGSIWKRRWRRSPAPWSRLVYQPRCLRNSTTVLRVSP